MRLLQTLALISALLCVTACGRTPVPNPGGRATEDSIPPDSLRALVESVHLAHTVAPGETLQVRLQGTVGPDGSWAANGVDMQRSPGRVVVVPRVRRVPGDAFIQMIMPLDVTIPIVLEPGSCSIEVHGRGAPQVERVEVQSGARRTPPRVRLEPGDPVAVQGGTMQPVRLRAETSDGWIAKLEVRGFGPDPQTWRDPGAALPEGAALVADVGVLRPPGDAARRIEARAIDGQGAISEPATLDLPPRPD
jgi:hypothetical protein